MNGSDTSRRELGATGTGTSASAVDIDALTARVFLDRILASEDDLQHRLRALSDFCQSIFLSEHALRQLLSCLDCQVLDSSHDFLLFYICDNPHLTLGILRCFIEYFPRAVHAVDSTGMTPLHVVCYYSNVTPDIARYLIEEYSDAPQSRNEWGFNPLYYLCANDEVDLDESVAVEVLKVFLEKCPACAQCSAIGSLPIIMAIGLRSPEFCCILMNAFPGSIHHEVTEGVSVLEYFLCSSSVDDISAFALLKTLVENHPDKIRRFRWNGLSPLHLVTRFNIPRSVELYRFLDQAFPELGDDEGSKPLHTACKFANLPVVKCILEMDPNAIYETSDDCFPIHYVVAMALRMRPEAAIEVVKFLLSVDASVASQRDSRTNFTPLVLACRYTNASNLSAGLKVIKLLYDFYPDAIFDAASDATRADNSSTRAAEVVNFLNAQRRYAETTRDLQLVRTQDENGHLPVHHALHARAPLGTIKLFVEADLSTLQTPTANGNTLLHEACSLRRYDVIEMLLTRYPTARACTKNLLGKLPIQVLIKDNNDESESADYLNSIFLLFRANPASGMDLVSD